GRWRVFRENSSGASRCAIGRGRGIPGTARSRHHGLGDGTDPRAGALARAVVRGRAGVLSGHRQALMDSFLPKVKARVLAGVPEGYDALVIAERARAAGRDSTLHVARDELRLT